MLRLTLGTRRLPAEILLAGLLLAPLVLAPACRARASAEECDRLLDRYVELLVQDRRPPPDPIEVERLKAETRARAAADQQFRSCPREVSKSQLECALGAPSADVLEQCLVM